MHVERYGTGESVHLGLHGWGNDHRVFAPLAGYVPVSASFYSADLPGCGSSPAPREWSVEAIVEEIIGTVQTLGSGQVTLVGHCGGAVFGLFAAQKAGPLIERVVALDPFAYLPRYFRLFTGEGFGLRAYNATFASSLGRWATNRALNAGRDERTDLTASFGSTNHAVARRYLQLFASIESVEVFRGLPTEVDLVYGEKTFGAVRKSVALFEDVLSQSRTLQLAGARHLPVAEATAQLARLIFEPRSEATPEEQRPMQIRAGTEESMVKI